MLSGDTIVIRGRPVGGPPPEKVLSLAGVSAPRLARRPRAGEEADQDEPFAWEAREFLRGKLVGKEVSFVIEYTVPVRVLILICFDFDNDNSPQYSTSLPLYSKAHIHALAS